MSNKKRAALSPVQKRSIGLIVMCIIVAFGIINFISGDKSEMVLKTAVITEDTPVYMDPKLSEEYSNILKSGDLVNVIYRHAGDVYYILDAATELPFAEGYISSDKFTYEFDSANQGVIKSDKVYKDKNENKPAGYVVEKRQNQMYNKRL